MEMVLNIYEIIDIILFIINISLKYFQAIRGNSLGMFCEVFSKFSIIIMEVLSIEKNLKIRQVFP